MKSKARIFLPKNRIETLVRMPGGISAEEALRRANANVEELRTDSTKAIDDAIATIEVIAGTAPGVCISEDHMLQIGRMCNRIILLAETYGFALIASAAMSLCDLSAKLVELKKGDVEPIRVYARTLRMLKSPQAALNERQCELMLRELSRILIHYGVQPPASEMRWN